MQCFCMPSAAAGSGAPAQAPGWGGSLLLQEELPSSQQLPLSWRDVGPAGGTRGLMLVAAMHRAGRRRRREEASSYHSPEHRFSQTSVGLLLPSPFLPHPILLLALGSACWGFAVWPFSNKT